MESLPETAARKRVRVPNFTADEKALLAQLIKKRPVIESKQTDGKAVLKKKNAWELITEEFNCHAHVHKRDTITLKRSWDNIKAFSRKARATERGNLIRTGGGPFPPPQPPQQGAIITMVEEAAPNIICEIKNNYDSDGTILNSIKMSQDSQEFDITKDSLDFLDEVNDVENVVIENDSQPIVCPFGTPQINRIDNTEDQDKPSATPTVSTEQYMRKPADYIRREGVLRIKNLEAKRRIEMQILKEKLKTQQSKTRAAQLEEETQQTKKRTAQLEEQINIILIEKTRLELEEVKKRCNKNVPAAL